MSEKRYYWLKLPKDFFKRHDIKYIESLPDGRDIAYFYLKLMTESIDHDGELRFSPELPYSNEMLASVTDTPIEIVKTSLEILEELKLVKISEDGTIVLEKVKTMVGYETKWAEKKRIYREQQRQKEDIVLDVSSQCPELSDKSKSKSKSKSYIEEKIIKEKSQSHFVPPTLSEIKSYCQERNNGVNPEKFFNFYESKGWMVGKNKMKDWKAAVRTWEKGDSNGTQQLTSGNEFTALLQQEGFV